jgi:murein DD-endopeptidase MepM/ murein hydrolase activator NlpD
MAAGTTTPTEAGQGPSVLGIAASIGAKIRDAAEDAKEQREKAAEKGETPKKGSLFKSALSNQFNPIKSKKAKSNWAKQFDWNKETKSDQQVKPPTGEGGGDSKGKLKEFIAGGFTAILKDTGMMVSKLDGVKMMTGENLAEATRASSTLTVIKDSIDTQTELRRKALEEAKFARAEKQLEKTSDVAGVSGPKEVEKKDGEGGGDGGGKGPFDWLLDALGIADIVSSIPGVGKIGGFLNKLNPFKKSPVTQGAGGKPPGLRMPGSGPRVTTTGGAAARGGANWLSRLNPLAKGAGGAATRFGLGRVAQGAMGLASPIGWGMLGGEVLTNILKPIGERNRKEYDERNDVSNVVGGLGFGDNTPKSVMPSDGSIPQIIQRDTPWWEKLNPFKMSEGGMVPSAVPLASGGVVDNPTKTTLNPGDSVIPLNRNVGKQMLGDTNQATPGETAVDTVGAMILGVSAGMLGKTESGSVGDQVKQDIRKASKKFGISNLTFTSSIGRGQFGKVDTNKNAKDFMMSLFKNMSPFGGGGGGSKGGGGGDNKPPGADIENTQVKNEVDLAADTHKEVGFTPGQQYGDRAGAHRGSDIGTSGQKGYFVALKKTGKVVNNSYDDVSGNWVGIDVGGGVEYRFMHLAQRSPLKVGDPYSGETIGEIGNTGRSSGEHLHFEKIVNGKHVDPKSDASSLLSIGKGLERTFDPKDTARPPVQTKPTGQDTGTRGSGDQASMPDANVRQVAGPGGMAKPAFGGLWGMLTGSDKKRSDNTVKALQNKARQGNMGSVPQGLVNRNDALEEAMRKARGYASGGSKSQAEMRRKMRASEKSKRATQQRNMLGVVKGGGKSGYTVTREGMRPGESPEQWSERQSQAIRLSDKLNRDAKLGKYAPKPTPPRPAPGRAPTSAGGTRPAPRPAASSTAASSAVAVMPPASASKAPSASATGSFGSAVPAGKTSAMVFADFLYPDLV